LLDPLGNLSVDDLDAAQVFSSGRTSVPGGRFNAIAGGEGVHIDLSGSRDLAGESGARGGEGEGQLAGGVLRLVDEGDIEGEEGVDIVVGGGGRDQAGVLSAESNVGFSLLDRDNQVGEEDGLCAGGGGGQRGSGGGDTFVDRDRGGVVGRRRGVDCDGDGAGGMRRGRGRRSGRGRSASGGAGCGNADVVDTGSLKGITSLAVGVAHAANGRSGRGRDDRSGGRGGRLLGNADVVLADSRVGVATFAVLVGHAAQWRRLRRLGGGGGAWGGGLLAGGDRSGVR
jgi:hypothetical protein